MANRSDDINGKGKAELRDGRAMSRQGIEWQRVDLEGGDVQDERIYKLLTLVLLCREYNEKSIHVGLEISTNGETVDIFTPGDNWRYSTDCLDSYEDENWHRVHDEDLKQAEDHLIKLLKVKEEK